MKNNDDIKFLRESVKDDIALPENLSKENIIFLLSDEKPEKHSKGSLRRFIPFAVAACIMITFSLVFMGNGFSFPETAEDSQNISSSQKVTYEDIIKEIKAYASEYSKNNYYLYAEYNSDVKEEAAGSVSNINSDADLVSSKSFSEVNLREKGVLEADIFITDGEYLYFVDSYYRSIRIVKAESDGTLKETFVTDARDDYNFIYQGLYVYGNYLIAGFDKYENENSVLKEKSGVRIYDVTDKSSPVFIKEIVLDGRYISSRITDGKLILISNYSIVQYFECADESLLIPEVYNGIEYKKVASEDITYISGENPEGYVNIAVQALDDINSVCNTSSFLGSSFNTYCTADTLYTISYDFGYNGFSSRAGVYIDSQIINYENAKTKITAVDISGQKAEYKTSTEIKGSILNDYSIDYYAGFIRVAVTKGEENCIYILNENLEAVGTLSGIAPGEQIKSARFMGNYAYVVTFRQTDPLFVIDLSNPNTPEIKGEVKLPGFSAYLHPAGEGLLVGIGYGGTETGVDGSGKISLFDVSDPTCPKEVDSIVFPDLQLGTHSKNFCSVSENSFLVTYEKWTDDFIDEEEYRGWREYTGALYISVNGAELTLENSYLACSASSACRSAFIDNNVYIYGISAGIASFNRTTGEFISTLGSTEDIFAFTSVNKSAEDILF